MRKNNIRSGNKIEIGILEVRRHVPILYSFAKICKTNNTNVTIFTTKKLFSRLETYLKNKEEYKIVLKKDCETIPSFLKRVKKICNTKIDLLFINTIHETFFDLICYLKFDLKCKTILLVHHVNAWLKPSIVFKMSHPIRSIDTNLSSVLISKFVFPKFDAVNVIYSPIKDYIVTNTDYKGDIFTLPTSIYNGRKKDIMKNEDKKIIKIVSPGLIEKHRKDYNKVIPAFEKIFQRFRENIILYILGWPIGKYGKNIYNKFRKMKEEGHNIFIYASFVPDNIFDEILIKSDILLAPINIKTRSDGEIQEIYGVTVGSGIIFNAIQYAKPIVVPSEFNMLDELKSSTVKYKDSKNLENIITDIISNPERLAQLKEKAIENSQKFSLKNLQDYFEKNVLKWLKE